MSKSSQNYLVEQERRIQVALNENKSWKGSYKALMGLLESANPSDVLLAKRTILAMDNQQRFMAESVAGNPKMEATFSQALGALVPKVIDLVRIFYPNLIANDLVDIQPLDRMNGEVFIIKPVYSNTAAGVQAGGQVFTTPVTDGTYASEDVAAGAGMGDGNTTAFTATFTTLPVRPGTVKVRASSVVGLDDGQGRIIGNGVTGTIDYATGVAAYTFTTAPAAGVTIAMEGRYDSEKAPEHIRELEIQLNMFPVKAEPHPLRIRWSELSALAASAHLDLDVPDTLSNLAASFIKQERDIKLVNNILAQAIPDPILNFDASAPTNYSRIAKYAELELKLNYGESIIQRELGRGGISWILCGTNAADIFRQCNGFEAEPIVAPVGPHRIGTLRDGTVAVIKNPFMDKDTYVLGFKGYVVGDAATILGEWIPLYATPTFQSPDLNNYQGLMSLYALVNNNSKYYRKGVITNYNA